MLRKLTFVRHAQSIGNTMTQDQRASCEIPNHAYPLTDIGKQQALWAGRYLKEKLKDDWPDDYCQSTFLRTQATLSIILAELGTPDLVPRMDSRLDEKWDGIFHELSKPEIEQRYPDQLKLRKRSGYYHYRAPGGENCPDVELRVLSFLNDPFYEDKHILVSGHGRWFLVLQRILHDLNIQQFMELKKKKLDNCSISEYIFPSIAELPQEPIVPWEGHLEEQDTELA